MGTPATSSSRKLFRVLPETLQNGIRAYCDRRAIHDRQHRATQHLKSVALDISSRCLSEIHTREEWEGQRPAIRHRLLWMLGLEPMPAKTAVNAEITGALEKPGYRVEKLVFQSLPGLHVTGNFYLPANRAGPAPCVVYLNGHWPSLDGAKTGYQDRYLWYPANGLALLVLDPLGFGEIPGVHPGTNRLNQWHWLSLGYTPAGVEVWNAMRALDWLGTRPDIAPTRIGVTGISGGGVMAQFLAALDERVAVAAPSCSTYTIGAQASMGLVPQQCDCTFYPNVFRMDFPEVLALIAPRPLLILGGRKDPIFPPAGFREAFRRAKRIYDLFAEPGPSEPRIRLVESGQGHTDPPHFLEETHRWMCRWLRADSRGPLQNFWKDGRDGARPSRRCRRRPICSNGGTASVPSAGVLQEARRIEPGLEWAGPPPERPEALRCTVEIPPSALNYHIHDAWIPRPALVCPTTREAWSRRKEELLNILHARVFGWFPRAEIPFKTRRLVASGGYAGDLAEFGEYELESEPGVPVIVRWLSPRGRNGSGPLIVWVKGPSDHVVFPDLDEFLPLLRTHAIAILTPRFADRPLPGDDYAEIERTAALVGRSVASMRVWDVLRTVAWVTRDRGFKPSEIVVYGGGEAGLAGLYAALMDPAIGHVILRNPPTTHLEGFALPTILRDTDIEEAAGILAPRRLTLLFHRRDGFALTRAIFDLMGAATAFNQAPSLPEALLGESADWDGKGRTTRLREHTSPWHAEPPSPEATVAKGAEKRGRR